MRSRAIQLALIIVLGVGLGLLVSHPWGADEVHSAPPVPAVAPARAPPRNSPPESASIAPPPTRTFKLPAVVAPVAEPKDQEERALPPRILVPRDWLLRGTGPSSYDVNIDRREVFAGLNSVRLASHDKNVANTKSASLMQSILADPWAGQRVEFSVRTKAAGFRQHVDTWIRATDRGKAVIAYGHVESTYDKTDWIKRTVVMDIPSEASEIAYGVSLYGVGTLWIDAARLTAVDNTVTDVTGHAPPAQLGVRAQDADDKGALAAPTNMDFEDAGPVGELFRQLPPDAVGRTRF